ncbi:hypothetical protein AB5N19_12536 [Seiridium cardinale]|uniref:Uncharacterized protein n=1 Tax=Seiridium cardinale TaxID=138064 RepID=A0ABR2XMT2_9PEZI
MRSLVSSVSALLLVGNAVAIIPVQPAVSCVTATVTTRPSKCKPSTTYITTTSTGSSVPVVTSTTTIELDPVTVTVEQTSSVTVSSTSTSTITVTADETVTTSLETVSSTVTETDTTSVASTATAALPPGYTGVRDSVSGASLTGGSAKKARGRDYDRGELALRDLEHASISLDVKIYIGDVTCYVSSNMTVSGIASTVTVTQTITPSVSTTTMTTTTITEGVTTAVSDTTTATITTTVSPVTTVTSTTTSSVFTSTVTSYEACAPTYMANAVNNAPIYYLLANAQTTQLTGPTDATSCCNAAFQDSNMGSWYWRAVIYGGNPAGCFAVNYESCPAGDHNNPGTLLTSSIRAQNDIVVGNGYCAQYSQVAPQG